VLNHESGDGSREGTEKYFFLNMDKVIPVLHEMLHHENIRKYVSVAS
jgi:hypothetical protein